MATTLRTNCVDICGEGNHCGQDCFCNYEDSSANPQNTISLAKLETLPQDRLPESSGSRRLFDPVRHPAISARRSERFSAL